MVASASVSALGGVIPGSAILGSAGLDNAGHTACNPAAALVAASSLKRERDAEALPAQSVSRTDATSSSALSEGAQQQPKKAKVEPSVDQ